MRIGRIQNNRTDAGFDKVKAQGLEFIEYCCNNEAESDALCADRQLILDQKARTGLDISCVGRWNHDVQANGVILPEKREKYFALLDTAVALGAKTFVCGVNKDESISLYKNYVNAIDFLGSLIERADGKIKIAVQNCHWNNFILSPKEWEVVLGELPELCLKYDPSHAYKRGADYLPEMSDWGERIAHFHIKGVVRAGDRAVDDPPAGMDDINWGAVFAILYARGYKGDLSIEPHSKTWSGELGDAGVVYTRKFIEKFIV
jgi:sugar phosphate isomerase/epimerase